MWSKKALPVLCLFWSLGATTLPAQDTPDAAVRNVLEGLRENHPEVVWRALPTSYQEDLTELVHEFANQADEELWNLTFGILRKSVRILDEKREYIFQQPMVAARLKEAPRPDAAYDASLQLLATLTGSELADINRLRQLDPEAFLTGTVSKVMQQLQALQSVLPDVEIPTEELDKTQISLVSSDGDTAVVRMESDGKSEEREFVRVEGKWVPLELAEDWDTNVAQAKAQLAQLAESQRSAETEQIAGMMRSVDGMLDQMLAAETLESFDQALQQLMGMVMFQVMSMGGGQDSSN